MALWRPLGAKCRVDQKVIYIIHEGWSDSWVPCTKVYNSWLPLRPQLDKLPFFDFYWHNTDTMWTRPIFFIGLIDQYWGLTSRQTLNPSPLDFYGFNPGYTYWPQSPRKLVTWLEKDSICHRIASNTRTWSVTWSEKGHGKLIQWSTGLNSPPFGCYTYYKSMSIDTHKMKWLV